MVTETRSAATRPSMKVPRITGEEVTILFELGIRSTYARRLLDGSFSLDDGTSWDDATQDYLLFPRFLQ